MVVLGEDSKHLSNEKKAAIFEQFRHHWKELFVERIYLTCQRIHPGMGLDQDAMTHISEILMRFLYEVLEKKPINLTELQNHVKKILPSALTTFVVKQDAPDKVVSKKENGKSKEAKSSSEFVKKLNHIVKDQVRSENIDDRLVPVLHSIIEDILYDILKWAGIFVSKLPDVKNVITLPILKAAINADRMLSDLMEVIFSEEEPSTHMSIYQHQISDSSNKSVSNQVMLNYEKIARNFRDAEDQYMRDLSINVNVFKRRLEIGIATDPAGKKILNGIFGNVHEIYELTIKIHRMIEDAIEMSDSPGMGMSFSELTEGCEFDSYITFMEIFREPLNKKVEQMLKEPRYTQFFDTEDRTYSAEQDGHAFRMAVKYVLPLLLHSVAAHFQCYVQFIKLLKAASDSKEDRSELNNSEQYFNLVQTKIHALGLPSNTQMESLCIETKHRKNKGGKKITRDNRHVVPYNAYLLKKYDCHINVEFVGGIKEKYSRLQQEKQEPQFSIISRIAQSIEGYPSDQKAIGAVCNEFIREGDLYKFNHSSTTIKDNLRRSRKAERHAFLFDPLLILCKAHKAYKGVSYKYKNHFNIRKSDVFDLDDEEEIKNAFKIRQRVAGKDPVVFILFCNTPEEKLDWMTSIVEMQTSSILHRMLEAYNKEEENRIPSPDQYLSPEQYRFAEANTDENIVFEDYTHNSGIPVVRSATLIKLIERLTYHSYTDTDYVKTFMTTYRSFCPPSDLLSLLIERFNIPIPAPFAPFAHFEQLQSPPFHTRSGGPLAGRFDTVQSHGLHTYNLNQEQGYYLFRTKYQRPVQLKVLGILNQWVTHHFYDFTTDPELLRKLTNFLNGNHGAIRFTNNQKKWCNKILETIKRKQRSTDPTEPEPSIPEPNPSNFDSSTLRRNEKGKLIEVQAFPEIVWHFAKPSEFEDYDLLTLHPLEIGRQVTLLHFCLYRAIKPTELVGAVFNKSDKHVRSPQLIKFIEHINHLTFWVARSIVETESLDERIEMLSRVLEIMTVFEELNNFSGLMAFCSALGLQPVYRLNESKSRLDKEKHSWLERFEQVLKDSHHQGIIEKLHSVNPPCVPFFGIYLSKITFMEDGHTTFVKSARQQMNEEDSDSPMSNNKKLISFMKCRKIANVIREIQMYQNQPYLLRVEPSMRKFFESLDPMNGFKDRDDFETYLYNQSYKIEPKPPNRLEIVEPKRPAECLKSPGIKLPKQHANSSTLNSQRHHRSRSRMNEQKSSPTINNSPHSASPFTPFINSPFSAEQDFGIVEINPGQAPRYIGDSGRVNQAFSVDTPLSTPAFSMPPKTPTSPRQYPGSSQFFFPSTKPPAPPPPSEPKIVLQNPPSRRYGTHRPPAPLPSTSSTDHPPLLPRKSKVQQPSTSNGRYSPDAVNEPHANDELQEVAVNQINNNNQNEQSTSASMFESSPSVPPRVSAKHLPPPLNTNELAELIDNRVPSPRSPTVSILVPLPPTPPELPPRRVIASASTPLFEFEAPPRPPKPRWMESRSATPNSIGQPEDDLPPAPPLPPKTYQRFTRNS